MSACQLCEAAVITRRYYEDDLCWIGDCAICAVPMVVWRVHDPSPPGAVRERLHAALMRVASSTLATGWVIDDLMRRIPDHYHAHARPSPP